MTKSKITKAQEAEMKAEHETAKATNAKKAWRAWYFLVAMSALATPIYLGIMVDSFGLTGDLNIGQSALAVINICFSVYFITKAIE
jgi:hypothetical protein